MQLALYGLLHKDNLLEINSLLGSVQEQGLRFKIGGLYQGSSYQREADYSVNLPCTGSPLLLLLWHPSRAARPHNYRGSWGMIYSLVCRRLQVCMRMTISTGGWGQTTIRPAYERLHVCMRDEYLYEGNRLFLLCPPLHRSSKAEEQAPRGGVIPPYPQ